MKIHIYEHITAGGLGANVPASLRREGQAMLDAIVADFRSVPEVDVQIPFTVGGRGEWTLVIAPEFDDHLRRVSQDVLDAGGKLLGSSPVAIRLTGDKLATALHWQKSGVAHPWTAVLGEATIDPPWVLKPRHGAGSQATFLIHAIDEEPAILGVAQREWPRGEFLAQKFISGQAISVSLLIGTAQTIALLPARQRLSNDDRFRYEGGSLPMPAPLAQRATRLALKAVAGIDGLHGYVGVDLVLGDDGIDYAIEINPRLTTSYLGLRQLCRQNLAELILRSANGETIERPTWRDDELSFDVDPLSGKDASS